MNRFRKAFKAVAIAQVFSLAGIVVSFLSVPLYLKWLGQERYGLLLTGIAFGGYFMFSDAGLSWSSMLLIARANGLGDRKAISNIVRVSFSLAICSAVVTGVLMCLLTVLLSSPLCPTWLPCHSESVGLLAAVASSSAVTLLLSPIFNVFTGLQDAHLTNLYQGIARIAGSITILGSAYLGASLGVIYGSSVLVNLLLGTVAGVHCHRKYRWAFAKGPIWQRDQIVQQLQAGAKSFATQIGSVLVGTAPVFAVSSLAGSNFVPYISIPLTLLNAPLGVLGSLNSNLQPGYGEAFGQGDKRWVAQSVSSILRRSTLVGGLLLCGFTILAPTFVELWTHGKILLDAPIVCSAALIALTSAILGVFRFALTGINKHGLSGPSDLLFGTFAMFLAGASVYWLGFQWVGFGVLAAALITSGWVLPRELCRNLEGEHVLPKLQFWYRWATSVAFAFIAGSLLFWTGRTYLSTCVLLIVVGSGICFAYFIALKLLFGSELASASSALKCMVSGGSTAKFTAPSK